MQDKHIPTHGPGHWHDPDMLVIGNDGITADMARAQMTIWWQAKSKNPIIFLLLQVNLVSSFDYVEWFEDDQTGIPGYSGQ